LLRNHARAGQSADWPGLDRGRSPGFLVLRGKHPQSRLLAAFVILGAYVLTGAPADPQAPRRNSSAGREP